MHAPSLHQGEVTVCEIPCTRIYDGDSKSHYKSGTLTLTNLRILYKRDGDTKLIALPLDLVIQVEDEASSFLSSAKIVLHLSPKPQQQAAGPIGHSSAAFVKFSVKQDEVSKFVGELHKTLSDRDWESTRFQHLSVSVKTGPRPARAGILGIERAMEAKHQATSSTISLAFEDMKQLITQAKQMVQLAHNIAERMKEQGGDVSADETSNFRSCLLSLGIDDPVTRDAVGSTSEYHKKLAQEICTALEPAVKEAGGVMLLSEVYCRINRARGMQLLSPEDLANACSLMERNNLPLILQKFHSGVQVLQLASLNTQTLVKETREILEEFCGPVETKEWRGMSAGELSRHARLPLLLAGERLALCERQGAALRDESSAGIMFYPNYFDRLADWE